MHATLDEMRAAYADFYEEAEAVASSTALAVAPRGVRRRGGRTPRRWATARGADRIPHGLRALVPASARRGIRKAIGRER